MDVKRNWYCNISNFYRIYHCDMTWVRCNTYRNPAIIVQDWTFFAQLLVWSILKWRSTTWGPKCPPPWQYTTTMIQITCFNEKGFVLIHLNRCGIWRKILHFFQFQKSGCSSKRNDRIFVVQPCFYCTRLNIFCSIVCLINSLKEKYFRLKRPTASLD